jgi:hypothetical protein
LRQARASRDLLLYSREVTFVAPLAQWNRNCNDITDGVTFTKVSGSCYPSQLITSLFIRLRLCTAAENHSPSCCTNHGGVYSRPCPVLYQLRPGQLGFVHINHTIDERNPKVVLEICDRCKRREQKHSWLKDKWANLSRPFWIKASKHTPCEICQNYQVEEDQPLGIIPLF